MNVKSKITSRKLLVLSLLFFLCVAIVALAPLQIHLIMSLH